MRRTKPLTTRLFSRLAIDTETGCLLWTGAINKNGYGYIGVPGRKLARVHRVMYELFVGPIPDGLELDHLCRVRHCASPAHLEAVTRRTNTLRGKSPSAMAAVRGVCSQGHPFDETNTYRSPAGQRRCRACVRIRLGREAKAS